MAAKPTEATFEDFWLDYLREHTRSETRGLHMLGTTLGLLLVAAAVLSLRWELALLGLGVAYGLAWVGHFVFEQNGPAAFRNPIWSLWADLRMCALWLSSDLEPELRRAGVLPA